MEKEIYINNIAYFFNNMTILFIPKFHLESEKKAKK